MITYQEKNLVRQKKMNIDFSKKQLQDIQFALCIAMSHTEKNTKLNVEQHPLIKRYIETYDKISEVVKLQKVKDSWIEALK